MASRTGAPQKCQQPAVARRQTGRLCSWLVALLALIAFSSCANPQERVPLPVPADTPDLRVADGETHPVPRVPHDFIVRDDGWIRFVAAPEARASVARLAEWVPTVRDELQAELGRPVLGQVEVRIARDPDEMARLSPEGFPPPGYAVGVAYARHRLVLLSIVQADRPELVNLDEVLRHELAHVALFDAVAGAPVPRWFNEGYAVHASGESSVARARTLWSATLAGRLLALDELDRAFPEDSVQAHVAYAQSADFVRFLLRKQDRLRFHRLIDRVSHRGDFDQALSASYDARLRALELEWREGLKARYSYVPVFLGGGVLWVLAFVVIGLGWARRRRHNRATLARWAREEARAHRPKTGEPRPVRVILTPRPSHEAVAAQEQTTSVPKVRHEGNWHTLH